MSQISNTDIMALLIFVFLIYLLHCHSTMTQVKTRRFLKIVYLAIFITSMEIITVFLSNWHVQIASNLNAMANAFGFALAPCIAFYMAVVNNKIFKKHSLIFGIPLLAHIVMCFASIWTGWIFYVSPLNEYTRGPLFSLNILVESYTFLCMAIVILKQRKNCIKGEVTYIVLLCIMIVFGAFMQICIPKMEILWCCVAIGLLLYYAFLRDIYFEYDPLTGVHNRNVFKISLMDLEKRDFSAVVSIDLNNLKYVNDHFGHEQGDKYIVEAAEIIKESFAQIGHVYRIGGDEFCIIVYKAERNQIEEALHHMDKMTGKSDDFVDKKLQMAYGYSMRMEGEDAQCCITKSNSEMYKCKAIQKKNNKNIV